MVDSVLTSETTWTMYLPASPKWSKKSGDLPGNRLKWGRIREDAVNASKLIIDDEYADEIPDDFPVLANLLQLRALELDAGFAKKIKPGCLPASLKQLLFTGDRKASWPKAIVLENICHLGAGSVKFSASNFPYLRQLGMHLGTDRSRLELLGSYSELMQLGLTAVNDNEVFTAIASNKLQGLGLSGGKLTSLNSIRRLENLSELTLSFMTGLQDITALSQLPNLRKLHLSHCKNIRDFSAILQMEQLQDLTLYDCNAEAVSKLRSQITEGSIANLFLA